MNLVIEPGDKPLAFSYVRLSSRTQRDGDGHRRQTELAAAYCERKGLVLDHTLEDIGVSGFSGANRLRGVLARFLEIVRSGRIPRGSHLIVESLDRLSRDKVMLAQRLFSDVLEAGIEIHTVADDRKYTWEEVNSDPAQLIISLSIMTRAHDESRMKLVRQREKWSQKREKGRAGIHKLTARGPRWLELNAARTEFEEIPERVQIIQRIFRESELGIGCDAIARRLNADRVTNPVKYATFSGGRDWHGGTIRAYLNSIAVRGRYQPNRMEVVMVDGERTTRRVPDGPVIENYYPPVIDEDQWNRTRAAMDLRRMAGPANLAGRKGSKIANLFGSLAVCLRCRSPMNVRDRGAKRRNRAFFMCAGHRAGVCDNAGQFMIDTWEPGLLEFVTELDLRDTDPVEIQNLTNFVAEMRVKRDALTKRVDNLLEMVVEQGSPRARHLAGEAERELQALAIDLAQQEEALRRLRGAAPPEDRQQQMRRLMKVQANAEPKQLYAIRSALQQALREIVERIAFGAGGEVFVMIRGGTIGYFFRDAKLARRVEDRAGLLPKIGNRAENSTA